jgi:hypothetical protein
LRLLGWTQVGEPIPFAGRQQRSSGLWQHVVPQQNEPKHMFGHMFGAPSHVPSLQNGCWVVPFSQLVVQSPQWCGSLCKSKHVPLQHVSFLLHIMLPHTVPPVLLELVEAAELLGPMLGQHAPHAAE